MELKELFQGIYADKTVLITGHTGFKGTWLTYWLTKLGANVIGYSLDIPTEPSHFKLLGLSNNIKHILGDIRDQKELLNVFASYQPDIVFHLAAQALVRTSYESPTETFSTNLIGTVNVLECCRLTASVRGIVNVTSDKCYENFEDDRPYNEQDRMGGYDPYSASKGGAELIANAYRSSFFNVKEYKKTHNITLASVRAGNVIGGGDWSKDRLIPDIIKATINNQVTAIRNPNATRPWQHVLEPLSGYLLIGQQMLQDNNKFSGGWNFGPLDMETLSVREVAAVASNEWRRVQFKFDTPKNAPHEANLLRLDCTKAKEQLAWLPVWDAKLAIKKTIEWYKKYVELDKLYTEQQLHEYVNLAKKRAYNWAI